MKGMKRVVFSLILMKTPLFEDKKGEFFKKRGNTSLGVCRALFLTIGTAKKKRKFNEI